ncbi:MAG TPA: SCP2 sterol-binding domain-containing protein [Coxiellaceae bacterium]|nr:MAG: hypothetical protein A3E81_08135 [Gammaproteobacteria bacterium RIFCSPHIGHO2_12_FULL_36_30]HLB55815.1 SCP2 sterol-binding domain-containing protein [Coxiellaceae bacterium]
MLTLFLPAMENIINRALKADPDALAKIATIKNQVIEMHCEDWNIKFYMIVDSQGLQFHKKYSGKTDTVVRGTLNNFLHIFIKGADSKTLFHYPIEIEGNTHNVEVLRDAFKNIDIDFEEKLSHFLGDSIAHKIMFHLKETKNCIKKSAKNIRKQTKEYIHYEAKDFVSHKQAEKFYGDVAKLRDGVERLEARLK